MPDPSLVVFALASSPWALLVMAGILVIDGFFPFVPGETAVVTLATLGATGHGPSPWAVLGVAVAATMAGDAIAFVIGRRLGTRRWAWMRRPRAAAAFAWASQGLLRRPALFLMAAKFVPFVRVAVTMTAGAGGLPVRSYLPISFAASTVYTAYHVLIALIAGATFAANPLLGALAGIVLVVLLGCVFELLGRASRLRRERARNSLSPR